MTNAPRPLTDASHGRSGQPACERIGRDGAIPLKYRMLMAMIAADAGSAGTMGSAAAFADDARDAGASEAEIAEALDIGGLVGRTTTAATRVSRRPRRRTRATGAAIRATLRACVSTCAALSLLCLLLSAAPLSRADVCGDAGVSQVSPAGCPGAPAGDPPPPQGAPPRPPWIGAIEQRDPQFVDSYMAMRQRILADGAIPAKYKLLMGMVTDAIAAHPDGVKGLAGNARGAGASEAEVTEAVEVGYLYGGTAALVMGVNAFKG